MSAAALTVTLLGAIMVGAGTLQVVEHIDIVFDPFTPIPREDAFAVYAIAFGLVLVAAGMLGQYLELAKP